MANEIVITIKLDDNGNLAEVGREAKEASKGLDKVGKSARTADRNVKGVAATSSNATKNFSKMAQGTGGLVAAYATLAANIFAISAAYSFLKRAGDLVALTKGQEQYALKTGKSMKLLTSRMQQATGGLLAFDEASQAAAIGTAAGLSSDQLTGLAKIAKNASVALGRDLTDSFNRLTKGAIKAEPELLDELGIILRLEKASSDYAKTIGKEVSALTTFEKSQAVVNAVLEQGNEKYDDVGDNVNQIARLGKAFDDLVKKIMKFVEPLASFLSSTLADNIEALAAAFGLLGLSISKALIPAGPQMEKFSTMAAAAKERLVGAAGTGVLGQNIAAGNIGKRELAAIHRGAGVEDGTSTVIDQSKMTKEQFRRDVAIMKADHAKMVAANSTGFKKYTANVNAYLLGMQAQHGKVMGTMKAAGAAAATGMSKALNAVAIFGMISLAITMIKEFIEYFKDPALKKMQNDARALKSEYGEQNEEMRKMIDNFEEAGTFSANLVKQAEMLSNQAFPGIKKLAEDMGYASSKQEKLQFGEKEAKTTYTVAGQNERGISAMQEFKVAMDQQLEMLDMYEVKTAAVTKQQVDQAKITKYLAVLVAGEAVSGVEKYNHAIDVLSILIPSAAKRARELSTVLTPNKMAVLGIQQTAKGFDKLVYSLKHTKSEYSSLIQFGDQFSDQLKQMEEQSGGTRMGDLFDPAQLAAFKAYLGEAVKGIRLSKVIEMIATKTKATRKAEYDIEIASLDTREKFLKVTRDMRPIEKDVATARNKVKVIQDKIVKAEQKINIEKGYGIEQDQTKIDVQQANIRILEQEKLHAQDIVDLKQAQSDVAQKIFDLGVDGQIRSAQEALLDLDQKRLDIAQGRLELLEKEQNRTLNLAKISYGRSSPFAFLTQDKFNAKADLKAAKDQEEGKIKGIEAERKMKVALIEMEYELLDAKLAALQYELTSKSLDKKKYTEPQRVEMNRMATLLGLRRDKMMGRVAGVVDPDLPTASGAAIEIVNAQAASATTEIADNIERLTEAKEDLTDVKVLTDGIAVSLAEGMGSAFEGLIQGTMNAKQAFASMAQGVLQAIAKIISEMMVAKLLSSSLFGGVFGLSAPAASTRYGGIVTPAGKAPGYATGGIARGSQSGYPVMMHGTEAVVPLPNGKSIPVEMSGSGTNNISINVNMDNSGNSQTSGDRGKDTGGQLGKMLASAVQDELHKQKRPGGLLSPLGATG